MKKTQRKSTGGSILSAAGGMASAIPGIGSVVDVGLQAAGAVVDLFAKKKQEDEARKAAQLQTDKNEMAAMGEGLVEGGTIKGKGTGKSDSIKAKMNAGDFIVPAENAEKAKKLRKEHFGDEDQTATKQDGDTPVNVSNGEVRFTKDEMEYLDEIGEGSKVRGLAPKAEEGNSKEGGGTIAEKIKKIADQGNKTILDKQKVITDVARESITKSNDKFTDTNKMQKVNPLTRVTPMQSVLNAAKSNSGAILGGVQTLVGAIQSGKNAKEERAIQPIKSQAATFNSEAIETKAAAEKAAQSIMTGTEADADRAAGNYMKMAKESGGASSANVLAGAAKVGQASSEGYLKGMTSAAQLKLSGQQAASEMRMKGAENVTQTDMYNDQAKRKFLEQKSANSNNLVSAGIQNAVMSTVRKDYNTKMADLEKNVKNNLTLAKGGTIKRTKKVK